MSRYAINSLLYHLKKDPALRARFIEDPAAAVAVAYFAVREGREAWHGELVCDD